MKEMKGKFLKKLKSIGHIGSFRRGRVLQMNASVEILDPVPPDSEIKNIGSPLICSLSLPDPDSVDVAEIMRDLGEEEQEGEGEGNTCPEVNIIMEKENIQPAMETTKTMTAAKENSGTKCFHRQQQKGPLSELDVCVFRRPDLNSGSLFDPDLLMAFHKVVTAHLQPYESPNNANAENLSRGGTPPVEDPLSGFQLRGPPVGGSDSVVLYTTSIRGIRKTFDDCSSIRFLLKSLKIVFFERDVSMHREFREELWGILGARVVPPRLFIKGRYIGGVDEVVGLHEQGKLVGLLRGMPVDQSGGTCDVCGGVRFVLCSECSGSCKIIAKDGDDDDEDGVLRPLRCTACNENGLIVCSSCCV